MFFVFSIYLYYIKKSSRGGGKKDLHSAQNRRKLLLETIPDDGWSEISGRKVFSYNIRKLENTPRTFIW